MELSIIIVSWNTKERLRQNLQALKTATGDFSREIIVVDNNSQDGTVEMIKAEFPEIILIANSDNLGFSRAVNQGIKIARGDFVLLLNPDMLVNPDTLINMLVWSRNHPAAVVIGGRLQNESGQDIINVRRFPTWGDQLAIILKIPHIFSKILNHYLFKNFDYQSAAAVDSVRGSFFMINREAWDKLNLGELKLDERYFIWFEEVDFCRQVKQAGGEVWYTPAATAIDYVGQSFKQIDSLTTQVYFRDSMLKYFYKWQPRWQGKILQSAWGLMMLIMKSGVISGRRSSKNRT